MSDGVWGDLRNESEASDGRSRGKISGTEKGKERKGGRKKKRKKIYEKDGVRKYSAQV